MAGLCFLSACLFSNATAALWVGGGLNILFFLMQMVSQVGDKFEFLKNVNPLTLFDYYGLAAGDASAVGGCDRADRWRGGAVRRGGCGLRSARPQHLEHSARERTGTALGRSRPLMFTPALQPA